MIIMIIIIVIMMIILPSADVLCSAGRAERAYVSELKAIP